ncbi:MAG: lipopolysaccharide transport periplasmic protein LptA [Nitrospirota bacterium]
MGFLVFIILVVSAVCASAKVKSPVKNASLASRDIPVIVTARSLLADNKARMVTYKKDVVVKKGDITLTADEVIIHLKKDNKVSAKGKAGGDVFQQGSGKIDTITAKGNVKIVQQDKTATSDKATYYSGTDSFVLTGKPRVWQGDNVITGDKIAYNIKDDTFQVEDAKTVLYQQGGLAGQAGLPGRTKKAGGAGNAARPTTVPKSFRPGLPKSSKGINIP